LYKHAHGGTAGSRTRRLAALAAGIAAVVGLGVLGPVSAASAAPLTKTSSARTLRLGPVAGADLQYVSNTSIGDEARPNADVRTVVLVIHGDSRDVSGAAGSTLSAASSAGKLGSTAVIAPAFLAGPDSHAGRMYWNEDGWKAGDPSLDASHLSSFTVLDRLIARVQDGRFPNLDRIVVAGHSAGGQFVQRFAAGSTAPGVDEYVVSNPSSWMYFSTARWAGSTLRELTAVEKAACRRFNDYKHGMANRNPYMASVPDVTLKSNYAAHPVTYLLGTADTSRIDNLDTSCSADWQGKNRLERGRDFFAYERSVWGANPVGHREVEVPNVGHTWSGMVKSSVGRKVVFG
jgi:pimeloyl-ACP methyl ester carboxylesterase